MARIPKSLHLSKLEERIKTGRYSLSSFRSEVSVSAEGGRSAIQQGKCHPLPGKTRQRSRRPGYPPIGLTYL